MIAKYPITTGQNTGYLVAIPNNYDENKKYPVKFFIHGIGQIADGTDAGLDSLDELISNTWYRWVEKLDEYGVILVAPQLLYTHGNWRLSYIDEAIKFAEKNFSVDQTRYYLAGHSLAGQIVYGWPAQSLTHGKKFAAIIGCCCVSVNANYTNIKSPTRAYHAINDNAVPYLNSEIAIKGINAGSPATAARLINFGSGHDIVQDVFDDDETYKWMLAQSTTATPPTPTPPEIILQADASATKTEVVGNVAVLDGSRSKGYKQTAQGFKDLWWEFVSGPNYNVFPEYNKIGEIKEIRNLQTGVYKFKHFARNGDNVSSDTVSIAVVSPSSKVFVESQVPTNSKKVTVYEDKRVEFT